jgi:hypothetical protein
MVAEWTVWAPVILDYQTAIVWSLLPWLERSTHCWSSLFSRPREAALPSHVWSGVLEALATRLDLVAELARLDSHYRTRLWAQFCGTHAQNRHENTVVLLSIFPRRISPTASMSDAMEVDGREPRGTKRTADEAGLPREAPRRIKPLDKDVVNKIAAGEIIVAPMHALVSSVYDEIDVLPELTIW